MQKYHVLVSSYFLPGLSRTSIVALIVGGGGRHDAWLMKIEPKREEPGEINKDDGINKAMEDQAPATKEEDINLITIFLPQLRLMLSR